MIRLAGNGDVEGVKKLLDNGVNVNATSGAYRQTALHAACSNSSPNTYEASMATAKLLVDRGANVNAVNELTFTPLCTAVSLRRRDMASFLIDDCGASLGRVTPDGVDIQRTVLHRAAGGDDSEMIELLADRGAAVDELTSGGLDALHISVSALSLSCLVKLLQKGATKGLGDALVRAVCDRPASGIALTLLRAGADPRFREAGPGGLSVLMNALCATNPSVAVIETLLVDGERRGGGGNCMVHCCDCDGESPLQFPSAPQFMELLLAVPPLLPSFLV